MIIATITKIEKRDGLPKTVRWKTACVHEPQFREYINQISIVDPAAEISFERKDFNEEMMEQLFTELEVPVDIEISDLDSEKEPWPWAVPALWILHDAMARQDGIGRQELEHSLMSLMRRCREIGRPVGDGMFLLEVAICFADWVARKYTEKAKRQGFISLSSNVILKHHDVIGTDGILLLLNEKSDTICINHPSDLFPYISKPAEQSTPSPEMAAGHSVKARVDSDGFTVGRSYVTVDLCYAGLSSKGFYLVDDAGRVRSPEPSLFRLVD